MKIFLNSVGCRLNQGEIERISNQFRMAGHEIADTVEGSEMVVINTCTVTSAAAADSRRLARQAHRRNPEAQIVLTGCWSSLEEQDAWKLPGVSQVISNVDKDQLVAIMLNLSNNSPEMEPTIRYPLEGPRARTRAFIKAQDGCDNSCTFCITTIARGNAQSLSPHRITQDIDAAIAAGIKEIVLTGVQLTSYGKDRTDVPSLKALVQFILEQTAIPRLRLSSLEPWEITSDFFELWQNSRVCRQLHLPLQSGSEATLRRMGRPISPGGYAQLISQARSTIPSVAITTDIIVGFPGETKLDFKKSLDFIERMAFSEAHVFTFSPRQGTPAYKLPNRVPIEIARQRNKTVRSTVAKSSQSYRARFVGKQLEVLWETTYPQNENEWELRGLSDNYLRVRAITSENLRNQIHPVRVSKVEGDSLFADILR